MNEAVLSGIILIADDNVPDGILIPTHLIKGWQSATVTQSYCANKKTIEDIKAWSNKKAED